MCVRACVLIKKVKQLAMHVLSIKHNSTRSNTSSIIDNRVDGMKLHKNNNAEQAIRHIGTSVEVERFKAMHPVEVGKDTNGVGDAGVQTVDDVLQLFL
jgi:hypothetical protein